MYFWLVPIYLAVEIPSGLGWRDNAQFKLWPQFAGATHLRESNYGYGKEGERSIQQRLFQLLICGLCGLLWMLLLFFIGAQSMFLGGNVTLIVPYVLQTMLLFRVVL